MSPILVLLCHITIVVLVSSLALAVWGGVLLRQHCALLVIVIFQQLESELKKLQAIIQEGTQSFDEVLMQLFMQKIQAELAVFQVNTFSQAHLLHS